MQQMQQMQQMQSPVFRDYPNSYGQQHMMSPQQAGGQSEYVQPWQLHSSVQNAGQFYQTPSQQTMQRNAYVSQTMAQGYAGEAPQMQYLQESSGPNPMANQMVLQVSPQSQIFRHVDIRQMPNVSEQGMMSVGAQAGNSAQSPDRYSGTDSSPANTAVRVQPSRGAHLLTQALGNYLSSSPYSQGEDNGFQHVVVNHSSHFANAMPAVSMNPPAHG